MRDAKKQQEHRPLWEKAVELKTRQILTTYARRLLNGNVADADELVQATTCQAFLSQGDLASIYNPVGYLLRIMRNIWTSEWRKKNGLTLESLDDLLSRRALENEPTVEPDVLRLLENEELEQAFRVTHGPLDDREELLLRLYLKGYKCHEIAAMLNEDKRIISVELNAVRSKVRYRLARARRTKRASGKQ